MILGWISVDILGFCNTALHLVSIANILWPLWPEMRAEI